MARKWIDEGVTLGYWLERVAMRLGNTMSIPDAYALTKDNERALIVAYENGLSILDGAAICTEKR